MPKEIIFVGPELVDIEGIGEEYASEAYVHNKYSPYPAYRRGIVVRWDKGSGHVELGVSKVNLGDHIERESHYTQSMSRQELNNLIRVLRQARDGAHGRDE